MISCEGIEFRGRVVGMSGALAASLCFQTPPPIPTSDLCVFWHAIIVQLGDCQAPTNTTPTNTPPPLLYPSLPPTSPHPSHRPTGPGNTQNRGTLGGNVVPWIPWNPAEPEKLKGSTVKERTSESRRRLLRPKETTTGALLVLFWFC